MKTTAARRAGTPGVVTALLLLLWPVSGCTKEIAPVSPGLLQGRATPAFGGKGDQVSAALGHGLLAFVDYATDATGGCENTPDDRICEGVLRVIRLESGEELARTPVAEARPALGDGFVVWIDRDDASGHGSRWVQLMWIDTGHIERLDGGGGRVARDVPPIVDGSKVAWAEHRPQGTIRILDLETRQTQTIQRERLWGNSGFAFHGGRLAWRSHDPLTWTPRVALLRLSESAPVFFSGSGDHQIEGLPVLGASTLAFRERLTRCGDPEGCLSRVVLLDLATEARRLVARPGISRLGPLLLGAKQVFWLDSSEGPYALFAAPLAGGAPVRITPAGERLSVTEPLATFGAWVAWASFAGEDFDLHTGRLVGDSG